jgi:hypothetical protein
MLKTVCEATTHENRTTTSQIWTHPSQVCGGDQLLHVSNGGAKKEGYIGNRQDIDVWGQEGYYSKPLGTRWGSRGERLVPLWVKTQWTCIIWRKSWKSLK